jgi:phage terminase large subunit
MGQTNATNITASGVITGASNITHTPTGMNIGMYKKTNCSDTETFNFSTTGGGLYMVAFSVNTDPLTTESFYVDVLNNVNGGSRLMQIFGGASTSKSINTSTNILTITNTYSGGTLYINKIFSY